MNRHLTAQERSAWACGDRPPAVRAHVENCPGCERSLQAFDSALQGFRSAVTNWSAQPPPAPSGAASATWNKLTFAAAAILFGGLLSLSFLPGRIQPQSPEDAVLLRQIGAEIAREVPSPMEPLLNLIDETATG